MENLSSFFLQLVDVPFENKNVEKFNLLAFLKNKKMVDFNNTLINVIQRL